MELKSGTFGLNVSAMFTFLVEELNNVTYGELREMSAEEKAGYRVDGRIVRGGDPFVIMNGTIRREYPIGHLRPGVRNECFYTYGGLRGPIKTEHHRLFDELVGRVEIECS